MKQLYLDCSMGAAGDMLTAALLELLPEQAQFVQELNALGIPGVVFVQEAAQKCGICGTHISVRVHGQEEASHDHAHEHAHHDHDHGHHHHDHEHSHHDHEHPHHDHDHHHTSMADIHAIVAALPVSDRVKGDVLAVYQLIAQAESHAHGKPVEQIHFHEVGNMDAVADITAVCLLMERLNPDRVVSSPIHVGSGQVRCTHGILPVPAPATAHILQGVPIYGGSIRGELCTPTGAALLRHFVTEFGPMPLMRTTAIGYGMGKKDFPAANCVRALWGTADDGGDTIAELSCNLDDMPPEGLGFAQEELFAAGALDAFFQPIQMKKSRPGVMLTVLCRQEDRDRMAELIFRHTTTLGVRYTLRNRYTLPRRWETIQTPLGPVRKKLAQGYGVTREKWEHDDLARLAREHNLSLEEIRRRLEQS